MTGRVGWTCHSEELGRTRYSSDTSHTPERITEQQGPGPAFFLFLPSAAFFPLFSVFALGYQQVCVLGLHLAKELCEVDEDGDSWLQVTRRLPILPTLLSTMEVSLRMKQNLHFTEAALHLLLTLARTQQVGGCLGWKRHPACVEWFPCSQASVPLPALGKSFRLHPIMGFSSREPQQWLEPASPRASVCPS